MSDITMPEGYEAARHQEFNSFDESIDFLRESCGVCFKASKCRLNYDLRVAMGENYPYWHDAFVKITSKNKSFTNTLEDKVICTAQENIQTVLEFG